MSETKQHNLISLRLQSCKNIHMCLAMSLRVVCTLSLVHLHSVSICIIQNEKCCKWNSIHSGRCLVSGAKASEYIHEAQIFAGKRYYEAEEATRLEVQSLLQTAVYLWQELGMLFKFPLSQFLCPSLQNQLRSRDQNQFC